MYFAPNSRRLHVLVWLIWAVALLVFVLAPMRAEIGRPLMEQTPPLLGVTLHDERRGPLFPWQPRYRFRKWAWKRYCAWRQAYRRAQWTARLARLALTGALTMAQVVDMLTQSQLRRHLGALPMLYALLETLQVRQVINRY